MALKIYLACSCKQQYNIPIHLIDFFFFFTFLNAAEEAVGERPTWSWACLVYVRVCVCVCCKFVIHESADVLWCFGLWLLCK